MSQDEIIALQTKAGLPESWQPDYRTQTINGLNFSAMLRLPLEISASQTKAKTLCIQTINGEIWIDQQILIVNDPDRHRKENCL